MRALMAMYAGSDGSDSDQKCGLGAWLMTCLTECSAHMRMTHVVNMMTMMRMTMVMIGVEESH